MMVKYIGYLFAFGLISSSAFAMDDSKQELQSSSALAVQQRDDTFDKDHFDFLTTKFPELKKQADNPFMPCYEETKHYTKLQLLAKDKEKAPEDVLLDGAKDVMAKKTLHFFGPEYEQFVLKQVKPFIEGLQKDHPIHGYYGTFFSRALKNHNLLEDLLLASEYIYQLVKDEGGGTVLFLGRTPCLVQVAYDEVLAYEKDEGQASVHLNFSGHPDTLTKRESSFFRTETNIARDMVSPVKLAHYFEYMESKGLSRAKKLFIVDILGSGSSLNSFLRVVNAYYQEKSTPTPELTFLHLTQDVIWSIDRSEFYTFEQKGNMASRGFLHLPKDEERNFRPFSIPAYGIPVFDKLLTEMLDQDMFQEFLVHGVQYPAQRWVPEFDTERDKGAKHYKPFYKYLRLNFGQYIEYHQKFRE